MISLEKTSGLPLEMREDFSLVGGEGLTLLEPQVREFSAIKNYLKDPSAKYWRRDVYQWYPDVAMQADLKKIHGAGFEYQLLVISPGKIGDEFVKTRGHYHSLKPDTQVRYPEVFEVVYGKAFVLMQSASEDLDRLSEAYLLTAGRGEKFIVPPGFGHVAVNPTESVLVVANWRLRSCEDLYEPYERKNGGAYYIGQAQHLTKSGKTSAEFEFMPNLNYKSVPKLVPLEPRELPQYNLLSALPMYVTATRDFATLDFLVKPENYLDDLEVAKLFLGQDRSRM